MPKLTEDLLARYYDGELSPRKARQVAAELERSPESRLDLDKMSRMGDLLRMMNQEALGDVSFDGFDKRVLNSLEKEKEPGLGERVRIWAEEFFEHKQVVWVPAAAVATVAIVALAALPFISDGTAPGGEVGTDTQIHVANYDPTADRAGSTIVSVNFGEATGKKYDVRYGADATVGVVWITEEP